MGNILGIDIGGTKCAIGIADAADFGVTGSVGSIHKELIGDRGDPSQLIPRIIEQSRKLLSDETPDAIGISIGGPLDHERGIVYNFPHLPGWIDIPLRDILANTFQAPALLDNDANLGALAEYRWGASPEADPFVYLTHSTGIGGGIVVGGKLLHGVASGAGELGHITVQTDGPLCPCGNRGCLERMASGTNIARHYSERLAEREERRVEDLITAEQVLQLYRDGDELAREVWMEMIEYLAIGLGSIVHVLSPERIVIGGGVSLAGDDLIGPLRSALQRHVHYIPIDRIELRTASLGHDSPLIGGLTLASDYLKSTG